MKEESGLSGWNISGPEWQHLFNPVKGSGYY